MLYYTINLNSQRHVRYGLLAQFIGFTFIANMLLIPFNILLIGYLLLRDRIYLYLTIIKHIWQIALCYIYYSSIFFPLLNAISPLPITHVVFLVIWFIVSMSFDISSCYFFLSEYGKYMGG